MANRISTPSELRALIAELSPTHPIVDDFTRRRCARGRTAAHTVDGFTTVWYSDQREHWLGWLAEYDGPGYYGRTVRKRDARYVYTHVQNADMLLYLGEATRTPIAVAIDAALVETSLQTMCATIRRHLPWTTIEQALLAH